MRYATLFLSLVLASYGAVAQCPDCTPDTGCNTSPAYPTMCPLTPPDATAGEQYQTAITFWMPATFTDPGTGVTVDFQQMTITGVSGLPFGLSIQYNQPGGVYYPQNESHGCAQICGTPVVAGSYPVTISILAGVSYNGFNLNVPEDFTIQLTVLPGSGGNAGFTFTPISGCGSAAVQFEALIDGSPSPTGYVWDFGDGTGNTANIPPVHQYSTRMPHLLIAGSTGSGKSVAVNTLISSLLYRFLPTEMRLLMIDPKMVELTPYDGIPHLLRPVVTNPADAAGVLLGTVTHMERRYKMMSKLGAKNLDQYNEKAKSLDLPPLPFIAIIIDELADLMITSPKEVESAIMRLAQMARATGMHLILATQRPSVDILTSLIKVNVPARMAFAVSSSHDSRTILDSMGAERLIGMGDMLYYQPGLVKAVRLQGPFVSENEIQRLADFLRRQYFDDDFGEAYGADFDPPPADESTATGLIDWNDDKLRPAAELVINEGQASVSRLQRRLSVGHARAGKLMDSLEALGVVGPHQGSKPREVLVTLDELPNVFGK